MPTPSSRTSRASKRELHFTSTLERSTNKLWGAHFEVPEKVAKQLVEGQDRRVVCTLNESVEYQCALLPHGNGTFVISVNKKLRDQLRMKFGMEVEVRLKKDRSEYGLPMPEELQELLRQDRDADKLFHALTIGKQRTLLYIIGKGNDTEKRLSSANAIIRHLKENSGKINYKQLGVSLRIPQKLD